MLKLRVIPVLTSNGFALVKTKKFCAPRMVGNPIQAARVYNSRGVDELIFIDINATQDKRKIDLGVVERVLRECFMPVAVGGGVSTLADISELLNIGADKVVLKHITLQDRSFLASAAKRFGSQALSVAVDVKRTDDKLWIYAPYSQVRFEAQEFLQMIQGEGAGEVCITSVDGDGTMQGFDVDLFARLAGATTLPVIASGGAGEPQHFLELAQSCRVDGLAAASIYHFTQYTPSDIKTVLHEGGLPVRLAGAAERASP